MHKHPFNPIWPLIAHDHRDDTMTVVCHWDHYPKPSELDEMIQNHIKSTGVNEMEGYNITYRIACIFP